MSGSPKVIIRDGTLDQKVMRELRFSVDDLMTAMRGNNIFDISDVQFAVVETNGSVSIYEKFAQRNVTNNDLNLTGTSMDPPVIIVSDGKLIQKGLEVSGLKKQWSCEVLH